MTRRSGILGELFTLATGADTSNGLGQIDNTGRERLGIAATTLLVIRPDGHIGLRAECDQFQALAAYEALLGRSQPADAERKP